jgi:hypothetical protein
MVTQPATASQDEGRYFQICEAASLLLEKPLKIGWRHVILNDTLFSFKSKLPAADKHKMTDGRLDHGG